MRLAGRHISAWLVFTMLVGASAPLTAQTPSQPPESRSDEADDNEALDPASEAGQAERIDPPSEFERQALPAPQPQVRWDESWDKFRAWQYPTTVALLGFGFTARFAIRDPEPTWAEVSDFEQRLVDLIAVREDPERESLRYFNDLTFYGAMAYRIFDSGMAPIFLHDDAELAWQMSWIDAQSFAVSAALLWGSQIFVGRVRPTSNNCDDPDRQGHLCDPENRDYARSFVAGHTATAIAAAGLTCVHHNQMPLYGGGLADDLACAVMIGNAAANAVTRSMVELHYPSDVLMGTVLGLAAGWVLPRALHYGWGDAEPDAAATARLPAATDDKRPIFSVSPTVFEDRPGLMLLGQF